MTAALAVLAEICAGLRGDVSVLHAARANLLLAIDLVHRPTGTIVEVDGPEHSTSFRLAALANRCCRWHARERSPAQRRGRSDSSVIATFTVEQRPQRTRTFFVM